MAISLAVAQRNRRLDALAARCNSGLLRIYAGSAPANADASLGAATLLAELTFSSTAFPAASAGSITANAISPDTSADATGTAAFFRVLESDGSTVVLQGTVTATGGGGDLTLNTTSLVTGVQVSVTSFVLSE